jgi:hypothetical protein
MSFAIPPIWKSTRDIAALWVKYFGVLNHFYSLWITPFITTAEAFSAISISLSFRVAGLSQLLPPRSQAAELLRR